MTNGRQWRLNITVTPSPAATVLTLEGRLSNAAAPELRAAIDRAITAGARAIVLNLRELSYISSAGLAVIADTRRRGVVVTFEGAQPAVQTTLALAGL